jgi:small subunit ribosomal protein S5
MKEEPKKEEEAPENPEEIKKLEEESKEVKITADWNTKTQIGARTKEGKLTDIHQILSKGEKIFETEVVESLIPTLESALLLIGESKGKFGGGQRRVFKQTQKKTNEGNKPKFSTMAVVGNKKGVVGVGFGKAKETVPAREKAIRNAKLNIFSIQRGSGSWESQTSEEHSIPFAVEGKCGSVKIRLIPAPKGKGLVAHTEVAKILKLAGIQDVWTKTAGQTKNRINLIYATVDALKKLSSTKTHQKIN